MTEEKKDAQVSTVRTGKKREVKLQLTVEPILVVTELRLAQRREREARRWWSLNLLCSANEKERERQGLCFTGLVFKKEEKKEKVAAAVRVAGGGIVGEERRRRSSSTERGILGLARLICVL
ncbi:uncharacterized protein DS421_3g98770 [Arachis hypogaea]|nr:uncharacterized protein DS421_3g98770 [Arachis hypogaea]